VQIKILGSKVDEVNKQLEALESVKGATLWHCWDGAIKQLGKKRMCITDGGAESMRNLM
jgi:hypothetical protein